MTTVRPVEKRRQAGNAKEVLGIGFGPANLALAIALNERLGDFSGCLADDVIFVESQPSFGWHRGMLIDGATMQVSFLKDLVTMRNPASQFSFINYLHARDRLPDFINSKTVFPLRTEFHDYLEWAALRLGHLVSYGTQAIAIRPCHRDGTSFYLDVDVRVDGQIRTYRTRNVVIGTGLVPHLPAGISRSGRVWHSAELLPRLAGLEAGECQSFAVVGAGQSAAEVVAHLHRSYPQAEVHAIFSRFGYSVADDSPFANRIFDPVAVDHFFNAPESVKEMLLGYHSGTNYSVVDLELTQELHEISYREQLSGSRRLQLHNVSRVRHIRETASAVEVTIEFLPSSLAETIKVDALIFATGYRPADTEPLLGDLYAECKRDGQGRLVLGRDYQVITSDSVRCGIYLHGSASEYSHGLSAGLLSTVAVRAGEIAQSIADHID